MNQIERPGGKFDIVLVEHNRPEAELIQQIFRPSKRCRQLRIISEEGEAMEYFTGPNKYHGNPPPDLILLGLDLPDQGGCRVLHAIKSDPIMKTIPVLILGSSEREADVIQTYKSDANCFIPKPVDPDNLLGAMQIVEEFWLHVAKLPPRNAVLAGDPP